MALMAVSGHRGCWTEDTIDGCWADAQKSVNASVAAFRPLWGTQPGSGKERAAVLSQAAMDSAFMILPAIEAGHMGFVEKWVDAVTGTPWSLWDANYWNLYDVSPVVLAAAALGDRVRFDAAIDVMRRSRNGGLWGGDASHYAAMTASVALGADVLSMFGTRRKDDSDPTDHAAAREILALIDPPQEIRLSAAAAVLSTWKTTEDMPQDALKVAKSVREWLASQALQGRVGRMPTANMAATAITAALCSTPKQAKALRDYLNRLRPTLPSAYHDMLTRPGIAQNGRVPSLWHPGRAKSMVKLITEATSANRDIVPAERSSALDSDAPIHMSLLAAAARKWDTELYKSAAGAVHKAQRVLADSGLLGQALLMRAFLAAASGPASPHKGMAALTAPQFHKPTSPQAAESELADVFAALMVQDPSPHDIIEASNGNWDSAVGISRLFRPSSMINLTEEQSSEIDAIGMTAKDLAAFVDPTSLSAKAVLSSCSAAASSIRYRMFFTSPNRPPTYHRRAAVLLSEWMTCAGPGEVSARSRALSSCAPVDYYDKKRLTMWDTLTQAANSLGVSADIWS